MRRWLELVLFGVTPFLALAVGPMLARGLGPGGRGELAIALAVFSLAATLGNFGQAERVASDLRDNSVIRRWPRYFIVGMASGISACGAFVTLRAFGADIYTSLAVSLAVPVSSIGFTFRSVAVSLGRGVLLAVQAALPAVLRLLLICVLFFSGTLTVFGATTISMIATSLGVIVVWATLKRAKLSSIVSGSVPSTESTSFTADVKTGAIQGLPVIGFALCTAVMLRADVFMLGVLSTSEQVGFYAATVAITESALAVSAAFKNRMQSAAYTDKPLWNVYRELRIMLAISLPFVLLGEVIAHPFTVIMFGDEFAPAVPALRVLILAAIALMLVDSGQGLLAVFGRRRAMLWTSALGAVTTVIFLWALVPRLGAVGAGLASVAAYGIVGASSWIIASKWMRRECQP